MQWYLVLLWSQAFERYRLCKSEHRLWSFFFLDMWKVPFAEYSSWSTYPTVYIIVVRMRSIYLFLIYYHFIFILFFHIDQTCFNWNVRPGGIEWLWKLDLSSMITVWYLAKKIKWSKNKERKQDKAATKEKTNTTTKDKNEYYINSISLDYQEHHWQVEYVEQSIISYLFISFQFSSIITLHCSIHN